jgi:UDP-GlcNAc:undecaprenyl-phosphate GlcNAc-1-phosphate transferase
VNLILYYIGLVIVLLVTELLYFRVARKFNILDKPNQRSSHQNPTIRGGGIIFFVAILIWFLFNGLQWPWMLMGMMAVALISFLDDLKPRPAYLRFFIHLVAVLLIFFQPASMTGLGCLYYSL